MAEAVRPRGPDVSAIAVRWIFLVSTLLAGHGSSQNVLAANLWPGEIQILSYLLRLRVVLPSAKGPSFSTLRGTLQWDSLPPVLFIVYLEGALLHDVRPLLLVLSRPPCWCLPGIAHWNSLRRRCGFCDYWWWDWEAEKHPSSHIRRASRVGVDRKWDKNRVVTHEEARVPITRWGRGYVCYDDSN